MILNFSLMFAVCLQCDLNVTIFLFRLCSLTLTRLVVLKPLENDLQSVIMAIKMQVTEPMDFSNFLWS